MKIVQERDGWFIYYGPVSRYGEHIFCRGPFQSKRAAKKQWDKL